MYQFHKDKKQYFDFQYRTSKEYIIPFVNKYLDITKQLKILEIGCAEAGVLKAFTERGHICTGIELNKTRVELARSFMQNEIKTGKISFITKDIYDIQMNEDLEHKFDLIILKDVIEHIHRQHIFIPKLKEFLNPNGKIFFSFPPWYMPFGGHQQMCNNKLLNKIPYLHLLPMPVYKLILKCFKEKEQAIKNLAEVKQTGITIERFEKIIKESDYKIANRLFYLMNPIYKYKFNVQPKTQFKIISCIPFIRNFLTTAVYYLVELR